MTAAVENTVQLAAALLQRGAVVTDGIPELARGVLVIPERPGDLVHAYLLKAAADRLTWLEHVGDIQLHPDESRLCALVDAFYAGLLLGGTS